MNRAELRSEDRRKRHHPVTGGYARGRATRAKIVGSALEIFGAYGFDGASTRMIADKARVNLPALAYYFGDKRGVYRACAEHIAARLEAHLGPTVERIRFALAQEHPSRARRLALLQDFFDTFADLLIGGREPEAWVLFIIREQAQPTAAFDILFEHVMRRFARTGAGLVGGLMELPPDDPRVLARTLMLFGGVLFFRTAREASLRVLGWRDFRGRRLSFLKDALHDHVTASLGGRIRSGENHA
ncbi:MAG: CerR family C-terminal domain-containing protein [Alphaproteobacteria bacterium]|nr:CerR family C-terminal domain-containing protein [Alphaproteobacteria bacterium]